MVRKFGIESTGEKFFGRVGWVVSRKGGDPTGPYPIQGNRIGLNVNPLNETPYRLVRLEVTPFNNTKTKQKERSMYHKRVSHNIQM